MFDKIFNTLRQDGKTLASQLNDLEKIVNKEVPKEHRHLVPNLGNMKKAIQTKDPNAALDAYNKAKQALKKVQDIENDQQK
jgi:hypothetical protein